MASRMKEDEKKEKIIRGLLKLRANRRCINCNSLGPQYVCTNFWTFICTNCSGLHREFTHRVKSISMAKFTLQEISALQEGGNERAKEIYFKEWDPQRHYVPDSSNLDKLRDFIKHVYVDRRYTGERSINRPPKDRGDSYENRKEDSYWGGSSSPPYEDAYERRRSEQPGSRSPGYYQGDHKRSPGRLEVVDEKRLDDKNGNGSQHRNFEDRQSSNGIPRPGERSPSHQKDVNAPSPPMVRSVRDILGDDIPSVWINEPPKSNAIQAPGSPAPAQATAPSSSRGSSAGNPVELKRVNSGSLIDFSTDPEPPAAGASHQSLPQETASPPVNGGGWASFDVVAPQKVPQAASSASPFESVLAELSAPGSAPVANFSISHVAGVDSSPRTNNGGQWPTANQHHLSLFSAADVQSINPSYNAPTVGAPNNWLWGSSLPPNLQGPMATPTALSSQAVTKPPQENSAGISLEPPSSEAKPSGRKELPEDISMTLYPPAPALIPGWQTGLHRGMGHGMQYPNAAALPTNPYSSKSMNPFDLVNERKLPHASTFPSLTSLQGALPNLNMNNMSALLHTSSLGSPSPLWVPPQQPSYPSAVTPSSSMMHQGVNHMPQQVPNSAFPVVPQRIGGLGTEGAAFAFSGMDRHSAARSYQSGAPNSFATVGGNPFG
ncbi:probable ADP-ribosylation factor GTPase-activating protein AGD14 isoform X2 [Phoenix dactylifera]|uniref:Probable ADP-ribosylation factor GTPase-activating protein AGD14 isoform X2 n=2 Tax=Phoenix dactylifera TaxID=42345 RepID=A0A8B7CXY7_PHODC|nr:probable ADP-ribosylation factor GTPase-activating protein AGD14 isoform X2 [Phoenix dactylifera]